MLTGAMAAGALGMVGVYLTVMLVVVVATGLYERAAIEATLGPPGVPDVPSRGKTEGLTPGRQASQLHGSAVLPPVPNDPLRQAHTRLQVAGSLREAASSVLENQASIKQASKRDKYLTALYTGERTKAATSIVRQELAVVILLTLGGLMAVWGVR